MCSGWCNNWVTQHWLRSAYSVAWYFLGFCKVGATDIRASAVLQGRLLPPLETLSKHRRELLEWHHLRLWDLNSSLWIQEQTTYYAVQTHIFSFVQEIQFTVFGWEAYCSCVGRLQRPCLWMFSISTALVWVHITSDWYFDMLQMNVPPHKTKTETVTRCSFVTWHFMPSYCWPYNGHPSDIDLASSWTPSPYSTPVSWFSSVKPFVAAWEVGRLQTMMLWRRLSMTGFTHNLKPFILSTLKDL